tara:strand:+ start:308 stop:508 length:201 start_codon:yes stop_codon:yes gene_type:complete
LVQVVQYLQDYLEVDLQEVYYLQMKHQNPVMDRHQLRLHLNHLLIHKVKLHYKASLREYLCHHLLK